MQYPRSLKYDAPRYRSRIMGPNPLKLAEELLSIRPLPPGLSVLDLGSGQGLTSLFLAREYALKVCAADLWSDPAENQAFFDAEGLPRDDAVPVKADAEHLPFPPASFDAVVSVDSYNYFGRNPRYLDDALLPVLKPGAWIALAFPGMKRDLHRDLPPELLLSWTPEQLDYLHDLEWWRGIFSASRGADIVSLSQMKSDSEVWEDWLACDNEYAVNDRKSMRAGAGRHLNFIAAVLRKK